MRPMRAVVGLAFIAACTGAMALPSFDEVKSEYRPSDTLVLDRNGELLQRVRTDATVRRGAWTALPDVSPALRQALIVSEDKRFWEHSGVDWHAVSAAAWGNLWNQRTRGASTITMQLAGLLDEDWKPTSKGRTPVQKLGQAVAATRLERSWRKDQILEAYLNLVPFRGEVAGIDAMSRTLFGKAPHGLDEQDAAIAAALVRAPNAKPAQITQRACGVLRAMHEGAKTDCEALDLAVAGALQRRAFDPAEGIAPHLARRVLPLAGTAAPAVIRTTMRSDVQRVALASLQRHLRELRMRNVEDGAVLVLDNATGDVLAWIGSSGDLSTAAEVDGVLARRQPGSTLKPFLYAQAIAERRLTAASLLEDSPAHIPTASGLYIPQNYDHHFKGWVSVRTALGASLNVPAVRTLVLVTPESFARTLKAAGLNLREGGDYYGYSLALGSPEVSLLEMTNAYRALANGGMRSAVRFTPQDPRGAGTRAIDAGAAFIVGDILSDPNARARTFGTDSILATRFWSAVKTGTSKDMRDNWALGWSQRYTVGVWVGNASGAPMHDVSGTSGAAPVWAELMAYLHQRVPSVAPVALASVVRTHVDFGDHLEAARDEWFVPGTQQERFAIAPAGPTDGASHITSPADGTIVALDPDIPPQRQRVRFTANAQQVRWRIDGKEVARGPRFDWLPWPGKHRIELVAHNGQVLDDVRLEVRGAGVRAAKKDVSKFGRSEKNTQSAAAATR